MRSWIKNIFGVERRKCFEEEGVVSCVFCREISKLSLGRELIIAFGIDRELRFRKG